MKKRFDIRFDIEKFSDFVEYIRDIADRALNEKDVSIVVQHGEIEPGDGRYLVGGADGAKYAILKHEMFHSKWMVVDRNDHLEIMKNTMRDLLKTAEDVFWECVFKSKYPTCYDFKEGCLTTFNELVERFYKYYDEYVV